MSSAPTPMVMGWPPDEVAVGGAAMTAGGVGVLPEWLVAVVVQPARAAAPIRT